MSVFIATLLLYFQVVTPPETVRLDFPESVELKVVLDYVAQTLGLNLFYEEELLQNKRVTLKASSILPRTELLGLARSLLRTRGLALVDAGRTGWLKVVALEKLAGEARAVRQSLDDAVDASEIVALAIPVAGPNLERVKTAVTALLTKPGGSVQSLPDAGVLVVTDFADNVRNVAAWVRGLESDSTLGGTIVIDVRNQDVTELCATLTKLLAAQPRGDAGSAAAAAVQLQPDAIGRRIVASGAKEGLDRVRDLATKLDVPSDRVTRLYHPRYFPAARAKQLAEQLLGTQIKTILDEPSNGLLVTARSEDQQRLAQLWEQFDTEQVGVNVPLRFYRLMNRRASDVFGTLAAILVEPGRERGSEGPPRSASAPRPASTAATPTANAAGGGAGGAGASGPNASSGEKTAAPAVTSVRGENFAMSTDEHTNTIILLGPPDIHAQVAKILQQLDKRRPQVLVEVTLVSISVEEGANLGVELETLDLGHPWDYLLFTSFGLSTVNPTTGARRMTPLPGGSGALIAPDEVPFIVQALASNGRTRIYSAPRILVDDNASGRIESVAESPFTSVNASNTVATTSFAGFAKAGTQLSIEPHIAEGAHLEIRYDLTVSSFTGAAVSGAPPPRSADTMNSTIRVPDGYTVVVGGLVTETVAESASQVPLIGDVPLIGWLFGNRNNSTSRVRLYAFIRPTVLRNEEFEDLKYISARDLESAELPSDLPPDRVLWMR